MRWRLLAFTTAAGLGVGVTAAAAPPVVVEPPGSAAAAPAAAPKPRLRAVTVGGYALRETNEGGYAYAEEPWSATVAADGTVRFKDRDAFVDVFKLGPLFLRPGPRPPTQSLQSLLFGREKPYPPPDPWAASRAPISPYHADPRTACLPRDPCYYVPVTAADGVVGAGGVADLTDAYLRLHKQDPYRLQKARFLAATFELRVGMAARRQAALLRASRAELPARLEALWSDPDRPLIEKQQILRQLQKEADADAESRTIIEKFAKEHDGSAPD